MKKTYQRLISNIIILIILLINFSGVSSKNVNPSDDEIDQKQTMTSGKEYIYSDHWKAQSFKPTTQILTRIELYITKIGNISSDIEIIIKNSFTGQNLTNYSIPSSEISYSPNWFEFNFPNISTIPNNWYLIIFKTESGDINNSYIWYQSYGDFYTRGEKYYSNNKGLKWYQNLNIDFCFKTYGKNKPSELEISYIVGESRSCIKYGIKNIGKGIIKNLQVDINISGGFIISNQKYTESFNIPLYSDETMDQMIFPIIGIGRSQITITVNSLQTSEPKSKTVNALFLIFYIYISPA